MGFKRLWSSIEWGFFYGFITWILGTGVSNRIPGWGVWMILLDRILMAVLIYYGLRIAWPRWIKGAAVGILLSLPLGYFAVKWPFFTQTSGMGGALLTGIVSGILMAYAIREKEEDPGEDTGESGQ
ncbi:hypothetical protein JW948_01880 [bacterium]|nr:hypothetical protein [bacterium]